ncbi:MAG: bifunctional salicylyl-CoA 5-hydroxylase/oxidoreductase [Sphingomonadales bacterium]
MKITVVGGGPGGLYFAISMKLRDPAHDITVYERNRPDDTFGWGVVFSDQTMDNLRDNDPKSADAIFDNFAHWDDIDIHFKDTIVTSGGHGFSGIGRLRLLNLLQERADELGIRQVFRHEVEIKDVERWSGESDLVIAADGLNSKIRTAYAEHFRPNVDVRANKFIWLGTRRKFDAFTFIFRETDGGWIQAHAYRFDKDTSTFIVETTEEVWRRAGGEALDANASIAWCESLFADWLDGEKLMSNAAHVRGSAWINFPRISNDHWHYKNIVLLGDAAHTAHFSIGSGAKLAFEDAIDLADYLHRFDDRAQALDEYEQTRRVEVLRLQSAARNSTEWFENVGRYTHFEPEQFAYSLLTRSQRVSHENLRLRDKDYLEGLERWFAACGRRGAPDRQTPPMFTPFKLRDMELVNRIVVSPMDMYSSVEGTPGDFHLVHLGSRALGGAGLLFTEMTCVSPEGRITPGCAGMYVPEHVVAWQRIVDFVHNHSRAKIALQLGHSGPKGSTKLMWDGMDEPLDDGNWPVIGPSPVAWSEHNQVPREMTAADMEAIRSQFVRAVEMGDRCGFDMIELHCAHGYLLSSFITPLTNQRTDDYGGSAKNRLRFPLEVFQAMRAAWPAHKPMSVRISATDWVAGGVTCDDSLEIARAFADAGVDIIDVSAGQTSVRAEPVYGRMFQTPFSDRIRNEAGLATMAVGNIFEIDHVNSIIASGRADLCCMARPHLSDPYWTLHAAAQQHYDGVPWPRQYLSGKEQYERNLERAAEMAINI